MGKGELQGDRREVLDVGAGCRQALPAQRTGAIIGLCRGLNLKHTKIYRLTRL